MTKLTPYRREVLMRLYERGPLTLDEARDGHPNHVPTLIRCRWAQCVLTERVAAVYAITDEGKRVLGMTP